MAMALVPSLAIGCMGLDDGSRGPFIDPDEQVREARAQQALYDGAWPDAPDPGDKRWAPETNLRDFPKLPRLTEAQLATERAHAVSAGPATEVVQIETNGDETTVTIYDPAPGVTPEALADELRANGKPGVQVIKHEPGSVSNLSPNDCAYGYARTYTCPVSFWVNNGRSNPFVIFVDHSSAEWPVSSVVPKWNQVVGIDSGYRWNFCPAGPGGRWCVDVYSGNYNTLWEGKTTLTWESGAHIGAFTSAFVQLNSRHTPMGWTRNNTTTHELGHVLGLGHNGFVGDVMWELPSMREDLGGENRTLLESVYSIVR